MAKWIHNISGATKNYHNHDILDSDFYMIPENLLAEYMQSSSLLSDLSNGLVKMSKDGINDIDGQQYTHVSFLLGSNLPQEMIPLTRKNDNTMLPWGAKKGKFTGSDRACTITLSNKSQDGLTFTYSSALTPRVGDYVFQDDFCKRSWITAVDTQNSTITFDNETVKPTLDNGTGVYSQGFWMSVDVPDWSPTSNLWGLLIKFYFTNGHDGKNDFIELSVVDSNDMLKNDAICAQIFAAYGITTAAEAEPYILAMGFEDNGEYGHWTKYYDESWVCTVNDKMILTL